MTEIIDPLQDAVSALLMKGHTVETVEGDRAAWRVDQSEIVFSDDELVTYAYVLGLTEPPSSVASRLHATRADAGTSAASPADGT